MKKILSYLILLAVVNSCKTDYAVTEKKSGFTEVKDQSADESIEKKIKPYRDSLSKQMDVVIGVSETEMKTGQPESLLGNFVCDLVMQYYNNKKDTKENLDKTGIVLMNFRGLRAPLPKGEIKVKNIYEIMPFENSMVYVDLKGSGILEMAKFLVSYGGQPLSSNCQLTVEADKSFTFLINGNPIDTNAVYTIITTDYLANGGDNMTFFEKAVSKTEYNYKLRDLLLDQIKYNTKNNVTITSALDGRITFK